MISYAIKEVGYSDIAKVDVTNFTSFYYLILVTLKAK